MRPPEALRDALAQVIADQRREWRRERELIQAQANETVAGLRAEVVELRSRLDGVVADRLAGLKDGDRGPQGERGLPGEAGPEGKPGAKGDAGPAGVPGPEGKQGEPGPPGEAGEKGIPGPVGAQGEPGPAGRDGLDGKAGERGPDGKPGKLTIAQDWNDGVFYEGGIVHHRGSTYQALRDTGRAPPHADWQLIAAGGKDGVDGRSFRVRGTWAEAEVYTELDVVVLSGASFVARRDAPGPCPGEGWQLIASQGKRGNQGERGEKGDRGERGLPGQPVVAAHVDGEGVLTLTNGDGSTVAVDFYPVLAKLSRQ